MSIFEPVAILALLKGLEPTKDQRAFETDWEKKVHTPYSCKCQNACSNDLHSGQPQGSRLARISGSSVDLQGPAQVGSQCCSIHQLHLQCDNGPWRPKAWDSTSYFKKRGALAWATVSTSNISAPEKVKFNPRH
jgi:hypothetical protein